MLLTAGGAIPVPAAPGFCAIDVRLRDGQIGVHVARLVVDEVDNLPGGELPFHAEACVAHHNVVNGGAGLEPVGGSYWYEHQKGYRSQCGIALGVSGTSREGCHRRTTCVGRLPDARADMLLRCVGRTPLHATRDDQVIDAGHASA